MNDASGTTENERLQGLLEAWFESLEAGEEPTVDVICKDAPELAPMLLRIVEQESDVTDALSVLAPSRGEERQLSAEVLGDFRIMSFLGAGGMGQVHLARQESLGGRLVALKVLHSTSAGDERAVARFRREAEIAAALDHPNIVPVYAVGEDEGYAYLAMKWLSGPALDQLGEPLDPSEIARIGVAISHGLHEAHETGVVHRDVKPGNIMLDGTTPYILDFGLARANADVTVTRQGTVPGTLPYMSPEQLRAGATRSTLDARTDVYSLGATLYELVSGRCPFQGDDPEVMIREILFNDPPPLRLSAGHRDLETIVMRAMDKNRERRFASAGDMASDLERYLAGMPIVSRPTGPVTRIIKKVRRHKQASMWIGSLLLGSIALMAVLALEWIDEDRARAQSIVETAEVLGEDRFGEAARMLQSAREAYGDWADFDVLEGRIEVGRRLEDLVDRLLEGGEVSFVEKSMAELESRLSRLEGGFHSEPRALRWRIVRAIAALRRKPLEAETALTAVEGMAGRDVAAIRAHARGASMSDLPEAGARGVEEHVFTQVVMRMADRSRAERLAEIQAAERLPGGASNDRVLYAYAVWLGADESRANEAEIAFRSLFRDGEFRPSVLRNLIRQRVILGRMEDADRSAALFREKLPDTELWSPEEAAVLCELMLRRGRRAEAETLLGDMFERYPKHWTLLMMMHRAVIDEQPRKALDFLRQAVEVAKSRVEREQAESCILLVQLLNAEGDASELESVAADAMVFLEGAENRLAQADALYAQGAAERRLGNHSEARRLLHRAVVLEPRSIGPLNELATLTWELRNRDLASWVLARLSKILQEPEGGQRLLPARDLFAALYLQGYIARLAEQWQTVARSFADALQLAEDEEEFASLIADPVQLQQFVILLEESWTKLK